MKDRFIVPGQWHSITPINYGYQKCTSGYTFGPAVRTHYLLHFICSGSGILEKGGSRYAVNAGDIFIIQPGEIATYSASTTNPWQYCWLGFNSTSSFDFLSTPVLHQQPVRHIFQQLLDCCDQEYPDANVFALTFELLHVLYQSKKHKPMAASDYAFYAKTYLDNTYMRKVHIAELADSLHIDRRYLTTVFKKYYGTAPQEYLTKLRLAKALEFLQAGYSVTSSASMSGFSDLCNFSRKYKSYYGCSPSSCQKQS